MKYRYHCAALAAALLFSAASCIGAGADISFKADGSGTARLEYRLSRQAESLGKLDGNEGWPIIPLGKADFERTAARVDGLRLRSWSSREEGPDLVIRARLDFASPAALLGFLDPLSGGASFTAAASGGRNRLILPLSPGTGGSPAGDLFAELAASYAVDLGFSFPAEAELVLLDGEGRPRPPPGGASVLGRGKKVSFKAPLGSLLADTVPLTLEIRW